MGNALIRKFKYTDSLHGYLQQKNRPMVPADIAAWIGTLSDADLSEFGDLVRIANRGRPIEDVARFMVAAMSSQDAEGKEDAPSKKKLERFLASMYSIVVLERKERLQLRGKHVHRHNQACSCCAAGE